MLPGPCNASADDAGVLLLSRCNKKADEHCQSTTSAEPLYSLKRSKHRIIKAENLHVSAE